MIDDIKNEASERMEKSLEALGHNFNKIRTGRAHPSLLDGLKVEYYGALTPLNQMANINVEDARTLTLTAWDKTTIPAIEKAIMKSDLGLNPATAHRRDPQRLHTSGAGGSRGCASFGAQRPSRCQCHAQRAGKGQGYRQRR